MASSSDWISTLQDEGKAASPAWIAALGASSEFREGAPFAAIPSARQPIPEPAPEDGAAERGSAFAEAYADGEAAGRLAAETEARAEFDRLRTLRLAFQSLDQSAMDSLASELRSTVVALCEQVIGECAPDPETLLDCARLAAQRIGEASDRLSLRLNPEDIEALGEQPQAEWQIVPDPTLSRGGIILESADGAVHDGPDEWRRAIAEALRG